MIEKAKNLIVRRKYYDAIQLLEPLLTDNPPQDALKLLVGCYVNTKQYEKAAQLCDKQIRKASLRKEKSDWQYRLADVYAEYNPKKALDAIKEHIGAFKTSIHGHALAIRVCAGLGMHGDVETYYKNGCEIYKLLGDAEKKRFANLVAKLHKAYAEYLEELAENEHDPSKALGAVEIYRLAVELDPNDAITWYNLGKLYLTQNNLVEADLALNEALKRKEEPYIVRMAAKLEMVRGNLSAALKRYKTIPAQRQQGYILVEAGQCAEQLGDNREAGRLYKQAIEKEPHKYHGHFVLGKLYKKLGAKDQAIEQLKTAIVLCRKETGNDHRAANELLCECEKMPSAEKITFRETTSPAKMEGKIAKYAKERGFGFIESDGKEFFFHISNVVDRRENGDPTEGSLVLFFVMDGRKGPEAGDIIRKSI